MILSLSMEKICQITYIEFNQKKFIDKALHILTHVLFGQESQIWHKIEKSIKFEQIKARKIDSKSWHNH